MAYFSIFVAPSRPAFRRRNVPLGRPFNPNLEIPQQQCGEMMGLVLRASNVAMPALVARILMFQPLNGEICPLGVDKNPLRYATIQSTLRLW